MAYELNNLQGSIFSNEKQYFIGLKYTLPEGKIINDYR